MMLRDVSPRKFNDLNYYSQSGDKYFLLPFSFINLNKTRELLVNSVGDFLLTQVGTAQRIAKKEIDTKDELYKDLVSNFFISEKPIPDNIDILATRYRTKKSFLDSFTSLHIFVVTLRCNHSCHYCQVSRVTENKIDFDISFENLLLGIEHMMRSPSSHITMEFQGGEPLIAFDKVKYGVEKAKELNRVAQKNITFVVCTNATIISDEILNFCKEHRILISTSLDGPEFLHNANRKNHKNDSYQNVIKGIDYFRNNLGYNQVGALMTTSSLSLQYPIEIINTYVDLGFRTIFLRPISPYGFALKSPQKNKYETERFLEFYKTGLDYIIKLNEDGLFFCEDYATIILKKMLTPFPTTYVDLQSPAGLVNSVVVFNYDGDVYASDEGRMLAENKDYNFRLGHVSDSYVKLFNGEKAKYLAEHWSNESLAGCSDCAFQLYCGADPVHHYTIQGDVEGYRPTSSFCQKNMSIIKLLFNLIDKRGDSILRIFYSWIRNSN